MSEPILSFRASEPILSFRDWNEQIKLLLACFDDLDRAPGQLIHALNALTPGGRSYVLMSRTQGAPLEVWNHPRLQAGVSPIRSCNRTERILLDGYSGCFALSDIASSGFGAARFRELYVRQGYTDEILHSSRLSDGGVICAGSFRAEPFTDTEINHHEDAHSLISAFSLQIAKLASASDHANLDTRRVSIDCALDHFGEDLLTPREKEVVHLVLLGHCTESVAHQLGVSPNTAKHHRLRAYSKLKVGSQGELFYQFLKTIGLHAVA